MYGLYGHLLARGQEAHINVRFDPGVDSVAIYPEIAHGNPLWGRRVVRYILNKPGVMSGGGIPGPTRFDPDDKLIYFSRLFGGDGDNVLFLPILDLYTWRDQGKKRTKTAYFVGKGLNKNLHPANAILIDRALAKDQQALANLLNECSVVYSYDPVSAMSEIARLCGTRVVMYTDVYTREDYDKLYEPGVNGMGWGKESPLETLAFREHYKDLQTQFNANLDRFIEDLNNE